MEQDVGVTRDEAISAARQDMNFFGALCVPEVFKYAFPPIFLAIWQLLTTAGTEAEGQKKLAIGIPRGFAKTLVLKLFVVWLILFTNRRFILIVCNTATLAENFIADVADILSSPNIVRVFGDWRFSLEKDTQELKKFSFKGRNITLAGLGSGSSLRGLNIKYVRPDVIIMDDMQSREEAESPVESKKSLAWMMGTLLKANDKKRCLFTFLGNMYPFEGTILKKLKTNPSWISFICGAILEDGESLWPELRSVEDILAELEDDEAMGHPEIFFSEVMNDDVAGSRAGIDFSKINIWHKDPQRPVYPQGGFVLVDPSSGKKKGDNVAIGAFDVFDGEPVLDELAVGKFNPGDQVANAIKLCVKHNYRAIVVESVAYQGTLGFWINRSLNQLGIKGIQILEINPRGQSKNARIVTMLKQLTADKNRIWVTVPTRSQVIHEITYFDPMKEKNVDDILDLLAYAPQVILQHRPQLSLIHDIDADEVQASFSDDLVLEF